MVLESLISPEKAERKPLELFIIGFIYVSIAIIVSVLFFKGEDVSLLIIAFTAMTSSILMYRTLRFEEKKALVDHNEINLLKKHSKFLNFFIFLFLGYTFAFLFWYLISGVLFTSYNINVSNLFGIQLKTIKSINPTLSVSGMLFSSNSFFFDILFNNLSVLFISFLFSLLYGLGAIFILVWNASVLGIAIGIYINQLLGAVLSTAGVISTQHYFSVFLLSLSRFLVHGIPEMLAYFLAGLAGGLISVAIMNNDSKSFPVIFKDSLSIMLIALAVTLISAIIEAYFIVPLF